MNLFVGVGVVIRRDEKVLLGKRKGSHGAGTWGLPGGHLDAGETVVDCARRETQEETGLTITQAVNLGFTSDIFEPDDRHYITLFVEAPDPGGDAQVMEPEACECWGWFSLDQLPEELFKPFKSFVAQGQLKQGYLR